MTLRNRLLLAAWLVSAGAGCSTPVLTAQHQPHIRYPSAPPPESAETEYTRQFRQQLAGEPATQPAGESESVDETVRRLYR